MGGVTSAPAAAAGLCFPCRAWLRGAGFCLPQADWTLRWAGSRRGSCRLPYKSLPVKTGQRSARRRSAVPNLKIIFPRLMRRAARRAFQIVRPSIAAGQVLLPAQRVVACLKFHAFCKMHRRRGCSLLPPKENQKSASDFDALDPRTRGCSPLVTPKRKSNRKKSSRFAQRFFLGSPSKTPQPLRRQLPQGGAGLAGTAHFARKPETLPCPPKAPPSGELARRQA